MGMEEKDYVGSYIFYIKYFKYFKHTIIKIYIKHTITYYNIAKFGDFIYPRNPV